MPSAMMTDELSRLVEDQVRSILDQRRGQPFTMEHSDTLESLSSQVGSMLQDRSMGRILNGPLWLSGASVVNGTITATKLEVTELSAVSASAVSFNVTGNITAAASFPAVAARIVVNSSGLYGYQSDGVTTTFKLNVDGSGEIGSGSNKITWTNTGAIAIPAALITSLTIANISGGIFGGTYTTSANTAKISLSTSGITVTDSGGNTTFNLNATTGAMTATGSFTVQSAGSGTRVVISSAGGIEGYNGTTQTFLLNAATGAGQLGPTTGGNYIGWSSTGVNIGGVAMSGGKIVASALSVTTLDALTANAGTITAGSITASVITAGTFINGSAGTINLGAADVVVNSTGKLKFGASGADYLSNDLLHFEVTTGEAATIEFKTTGITPYSVFSSRTASTGSRLNHASYYDANNFVWALTETASNSTDFYAYAQGYSGVAYGTSMTITGHGTQASNNISFVVANNEVMNLNLGAAYIKLGDVGGTYAFAVKDSANQVQFSISSNGAFIYPDADATGLGAYAGRMPWYINGNLRYVPYYN